MLAQLPRAVYCYRARPHDPWWELQVAHALRTLDTDRLTWLVKLAEAEEINSL